MDPQLNLPGFQTILTELRALMAEDSRAETPVVKSVSLDFWSNLPRYIQRIAHSPEPFIISLAGASGSGKSTVRDMLVQALSQLTPVSAFTQDNYYRNFEQDFAHYTLQQFYHRIDFDDPAHIQFPQLLTDLARLRTMRSGEVLSIPRLIYGTPEALPASIPQGLDVLIQPVMVTEGIHAFHSQALRSLYDFKIYVDVDEATRRARWFSRNQRDNRGTTDNMWQTTVNCLEQHILPTRSQVDLVLDNTAPKARVKAFIQSLALILQQVQRQVA